MDAKNKNCSDEDDSKERDENPTFHDGQDFINIGYQATAEDPGIYLFNS